MNTNNFSRQMSGLWISQSTSYSMLQNRNRQFNTFTNKIEWVDLSNDIKYLKRIKAHIIEEYSQNLISLCKVSFTNTQSNYQQYYVLLLKDKFNQMYLIKLSKDLNLINKFTIQIFNYNPIILISEINNLTLIEKIYFLNDKVKLVKSIIKKQKKCLATYFSSEIKIS